MRRTLGVATILCMLLGGVAFAGHGGGGRGGGGGGGGGVVVRDHRGPAPSGGGGHGGGGVVVRDHRGPAPAMRSGPVRDHRGPGVSHVRVANGRYMFPGGVVRVYKRPVIRARYYDVHVRPPMVVETYEPVSGYAWIGGNWTWGGSEWVWTPGYWSVAGNAPEVSGGVSVNAGISIY